ncbi:MAG: branched chain amino acid aminotransferase, partial [Desulfobacterales bacterium]|nr:branched chain amino acid aminotransferase [Desulfobacterales bacterium]
RGGSGEAKTSCNYGPTLLMTKRAAEKGYNQILWLDALERKWVEEVGTSNIFFLFGDELVTPPLAGTILPGITRDSVIAMARKNGVKVCERPVSIKEGVEGCESGALKEAFASGTAAVISPVGEIGFQGRDFRVADGKSGELAQKIYRQITDIQYGRGEDPFGWLVRIA